MRSFRIWSIEVYADVLPSIVVEFHLHSFETYDTHPAQFNTIYIFCAKKGNTLKLLQPARHETNFSLRTPGKIVVVLSEISLTLHREG